MNCYKATLIILFLISTLLSEDTLIVGGYDKPPYMIADTESGLIADIFHEAATIANVPYKLIVVPNKRLKLDIQARVIDIEPGISPLWRKKFDSLSLYTESYLEAGDIVIIHRDNVNEIRSRDDLIGKRVGCGRAYSYHEGFGELFNSGSIIRDDTDSHKQNVLKLRYKRVDAIIIDHITLLYNLKELHIPADEFITIYEFQKAPLAIRVDKSHPNTRNRLNEALIEMKQHNRIETLINKYTRSDSL